jgi:Domain of unknown function DUF488
VFLGKELGARSDDATWYVNGKVQYDRLARTELFHHGLQRVETGMKKFRVVLMCAERDPLAPLPHSDPGITLGLYAHAVSQSQRDAVEGLANALGSGQLLTQQSNADSAPRKSFVA